MIRSKNPEGKNNFPSDQACEDNIMEVKEAILRNAIDQAEPVEAEKKDDNDINQSEQSAYRDPLASG
ncbi:MAG TPA: hypothetical protein VHR47_06785 [Bacillota bacterium]|nr:hypothetical protein [Bacillota bacterium]